MPARALLVTSLVASGLAVGLRELPGLLFTPHLPHTYCKLCGAVYQGDIDRNPNSYIDGSTFLNLGMVLEYAMDRRKAWSRNHANTHSDKEHHDLSESGFHCTPDAAFKLAPFGIVPVSDAVLSPEHEHALLTAPRAPLNDCEG
jgi:hypothetical protein